jgi:hypothetical protein
VSGLTVVEFVPITASVAPVLVLKSAMETCNEHGVLGVDIVVVNVTTARTIVRLPVPPELAKGSVALAA